MSIPISVSRKMSGADLALKDHGRDRTLKGLPATAAVAARQTNATRVAPTQTFQGPPSAMTF